MDLVRRFRVKPGTKVRLGDWDADDTAGVPNKKSAAEMTEKNLRRLKELQYLLYAENKRSILVILQAMDAGGKDGAVRHVMGPLNPQSCRVTSFKAPCGEELGHDYLWRIHAVAPRKGEIRIFNRSHYEDVLIVRVHNLVKKSIWSQRYDQINTFERILAENGTHILKFYLHISKAEQLERLKARLEDPSKHWKINPDDFAEREYWSEYMKAYEVALGKCSTAHAPWFIIPANKKWFRNLAISEILADTLSRLKMTFPEPTCDVAAIKVR